MLSWKALSLIVAVAVAMNGVTGLEQGNPADVPQIDVTPTDSPVQGQTLVPAVTTAAPTPSSDSYSFDNTGSSVEGSSAIDEGSDSTTPFNPKTGVPMTSETGSQGEGSLGLDGGSGSIPTDKTDITVPPMSGSGSLPTGSQVEGSTGLDEGSDSTTPFNPKTGVPMTSETGSQGEGSSGLDEGSNFYPSPPSSKGGDITFPSGPGSEVEGSSSMDEGSNSVPSGKGGITPAPSNGSGSARDSSLSSPDEGSDQPKGDCKVRTRRLRQ